MLAPRASRLALALAATAAALAACAPAPSPWRFDDKVSHVINYTPRDDRLLAARYPTWVRFEYTGPQGDPTNSLWLTPVPLAQGVAFNDVMVLTPDAWPRTHLRLATTECPPVAPPNYAAVTMVVATQGRVTRRCIAGRPAVCAYADILRQLTAQDLVSGELDARRMIFNVCETGFAG